MKLDFLRHFDFFTGVPDSLLSPLCNYLMSKYGVDGKHHIIAANEGNAVGLAAGYHLATGKIPLVYLQNSGIGNIVNPVASLLNDKVYAIPCVFVVGWRGEPNVHDEPQHIFQGEITVKLLEDLDIRTFIIDKNTTGAQVTEKLEEWRPLFNSGKQAAFVVKKGALEFDGKIEYKNDYELKRENAVERIVDVAQDDLIVSTTGKTSRELFEIRERNGRGHEYDFLTVGSMGHSSSIALGVALNKPDKKVWCIDGDGAALMHTGALAVIGSLKPKNFVHVVINNASHESVGGLPTAAGSADLCKIAKACGYINAVCVDNENELNAVLKKAKTVSELSFIEIKCAIGSRPDLGRPTTAAAENKIMFMNACKDTAK